MLAAAPRADAKRRDRAVAPAADSARARPSAQRSAPLRASIGAFIPERLWLGRAAMEWSTGHAAGVIENLERIPLAPTPSFGEADRAAFLLGQAYLKAGSTRHFRRLAQTVAQWDRTSVYTGWLQLQSLLLDTEDGAADSTRRAFSNPTAIGMAAADVLAAHLLLRRGDDAAALRILAGATPDPLARMIEASARARAGSDDAVLARLAWSDTTTAAGRDLVAAAQIRRATRAMQQGYDPRLLLESVPRGSRYTSRARHMLGVFKLEHGEVDEGLRILTALLRDDPDYAERRAVGLAIASRHLDDRAFEPASRAYEQTDHEWSAERDTLERILARGAFEELWREWDSRPPADAVAIDPTPARTAADRLADASIDLRTRPANPTVTLTALPPGRARDGVPPPSPASLRTVAESARAVEENGGEIARTRAAWEHERDRLADQRRYLGSGRERLRVVASSLDARATYLDSLRASLDRIDARLVAVRDEETRRVLRRAAAILDACDNTLAMTRAMRRFQLDGADPRMIAPPPGGHAGPAAVLDQEDTLARALQAMADGLAHGAPARLARSYAESWRPRTIDRAARETEDARRASAWAVALGASLDSSLAAATRSDSLDRLAATLARLERNADSLRLAHSDLRARVAREAIEQRLATLDREREAIDYGLAASSYGVAAPSAPDPAGAPVAARDSSLDPLGGDPPDDPATVERRGRAIARLDTFLTRYPRSFARAEMRFRLADLSLVEARQTFRAQMADYLRDQAAGGPKHLRLPALSHARALDLYRAILAEDPDFQHRDAAMFNAGMILADEGDPEAERFFHDLVTTYPHSAYGQEAELRMGDMRFNDKRFLEAVELYRQSATGTDPTLRAIAYYKMGWAHYDEDRFAEAADAFRSVLDLYASAEGPRIQADLRGEAESYLIHSLAGAGGPDATARYFDGIGARPYEHGVWMALAQNYRRYGDLRSAAATDERCLARYPLHPDALLSAGRLIETDERAEQPQRARSARLSWAPRFVPGAEWARAQASDSVRAAGSAFARGAWMQVAREHHRRARATRSREDWREAARLYGLVLATWPGDAEAPNLEMLMGEASASLGEYPEALAHYRAAASSARADSVVAQALWQRVAGTDAWYERERAASRDRRLGPDSLGRAVLDAADDLLRRFPDHRGAADLTWREGQLAYAHGWNERAIDAFGRMARSYPGDPRTPSAMGLEAEARFRIRDFAGAGAAFERTLVAARKTGRDSLARRAAQAIPVCGYRDAEAAVAADSTDHAGHAAKFEKVAASWPEYEHAHLAQYRAGLAWLAARRYPEAVRAMDTLITRFPKSEYVKDAHLQIAKAWEAAGEKARAGEAYVRFATRFPTDESAGPATLAAADLFEAAGLAPRADALRLEYVRKHPEDREAAMKILEAMARRDLATVGPERPISTLLVAPVRKGARATTREPASNLEAYLKLAKANPKLASTELLTHVRFLHGEEAREPYAASRLTQPLPKSIAAKQKLLDTLVVRYRRTIDLGAPEWSHAAAFRIGEALAGFGEALEQSQRPADLHGDDLLAYEDVLMRQAQVFFDRGEGVWSDLLRRQGRGTAADAWIEKAQTSLWKRLSRRFFYRPEMEFPLVESPKAPRDPDEAARAGTNLLPNGEASRTEHER